MPKNPESGGFPPKHELSKESPEAEWARWKEIIKVQPQNTEYALRAGRRLGVPEDEIRELAQEAFDKEIKGGWHNNAYAIMKAAELGTEEERRAVGEKAYQEHMEWNSPAGAASIAKKLWGDKSSQYAAAQELLQKKRKNLRRSKKKQSRLCVSLLMQPSMNFMVFGTI